MLILIFLICSSINKIQFSSFHSSLNTEQLFGTRTENNFLISETENNVSAPEAAVEAAESNEINNCSVQTEEYFDDICCEGEDAEESDESV